MKLTFGDCVLDMASRLLTRGGVVFSLEPKMYALLELLIKRRPAIVSNVELDEYLWPNVYVERSSLTRLVSELRSVLGDSPREGRIIRTVYKTGYAFAAQIKTPRAPAVKASALFLERKDQVLSLADEINVIGRGQECSHVLDAATVSRRHARILIRAGCATIEDLGSTNGTFVNKQPVRNATALKDGDEVSFGTLDMRFRAIDRSARTALDPEGAGSKGTGSARST